MSHRSASLLGVIALAGLGIAGCAPAGAGMDPDPEPSTAEQAPDPEPSSHEQTPDPEPSAAEQSPAAEETVAPPPADPLFLGDDLEKVLLPDDVVHELFPGVLDIEATTNLSATVGESEGQIGYPTKCMPLNWDDWTLTVGWRGSRWLAGGEIFGSQRAMQFPNAEKAQESLDWYRAALEGCDSFTPREDITDIVYSWSLDAHVERGPVEVFVGTMDSAGGYEGETSSVLVLAVVGNAVLRVGADPDRGADEIADGVADALEASIDSLDPAFEWGTDDARPGAQAPISDWIADAGGIGPIRIGDSIEEVRAAVDWMDEPIEGDTYFVTGGADEYWRQDIDGGTINITMNDGAVRVVEVGADYDYEDPHPDGGGLPSIAGVRIGDPAQAAADAFPAGTVLYQIAPDIEQYSVADGAGRVITFAAPGMVDRDDLSGGYDLAAGVITSIQVEDATGRTSMYETFINAMES